MQSNNKKKICIVVSSLGKGGAEKSSALLSILLNDLGYDIHIISILNIINYTYKGKLLNLGKLKDENDSIFGKLNRYRAFFNYLKTENFDIILDSASRPTIIKQYIINKIIYKNQKVNFIVRSYNLKNYFSEKRFISRYLYKNANKIIAVSKEIKNEIEKKYLFNNVETIYNGVDIEVNEALANEDIPVSENFILFYGRIVDDVKNISLLIEGYKLSALKTNNINLIILGNGIDKSKLKAQVKTLNLDKNILFFPYTNNPFSFIKRALFTCLTSKYEGFPRVLIESLSLGIPVISVNCKSGPAEIIKNKHNGLLIENNNPQVLADAMNNFIFDEELYKECKRNAKKSVSHLSTINIKEQWKYSLEKDL